MSEIRTEYAGYDFPGSGGGGTPPGPPLVSGGNEAVVSLAAGTGLSHTFTFTAPTGGVAPYTYTAELRNLPASGGATLSGSGLSRTVSNLNPGEGALVILSAVDASGQTVRSLGLVRVLYPSNLVANGSTPAGFLPFSTTTTTISVAGVTGGLAPITYVPTLLSSLGGASTAVIASGSGTGPYTINGLQSSEVLLLEVEATDAAGQKARMRNSIAVASAPNPDLVPGALPAPQNLAGGTTTTTVTFNAFTGGVGAVTYNATLSSPPSFPASLSGAFPTYTLSGLGNGSGYEITVEATDSVGQKAHSFALVQVGGATPFINVIPPSPAVVSQVTTDNTTSFDIGSFSEAVTVAAVITRDSGSGSEAVSVVEPTPGNYRIVITAMDQGFSYNIRVTGTATDASGRTGVLTLSVMCRVPVFPNEYGSFIDFDFRTVTAPATYTTAGTYVVPLSVGNVTLTIAISGAVVELRFVPGQPLALDGRTNGGVVGITFSVGAFTSAWPTGCSIACEAILNSGWSAASTNELMSCTFGNNTTPYSASVGFSGEIQRNAGPLDSRRVRRFDGGASSASGYTTFGAAYDAFAVQHTMEEYQQVPTVYFRPGQNTYGTIGGSNVGDPGRASIPILPTANADLFLANTALQWRWSIISNTTKTMTFTGFRVGYRVRPP
jgi:hypothetical protein